MELPFIDSETGTSILSLIWTIGILIIGFVLYCALSALCLQRAVNWLGFAALDAKRAILYSLLVNIVVSSFGTLISVYYGWSLNMESEEAFPTRSFAMSFSPLFYLHQLLFSVLIAASVFTCLIKRRPNQHEGSEQRLLFAEGLGVSAVYFGLSTFAVLLLSAFVGLLMAIYFSIF